MKCPYISGIKKSIDKVGYTVLVTELPIFIDCLEEDCPFYDEDNEKCKRANADIGECI